MLFKTNVSELILAGMFTSKKILSRKYPGRMKQKEVKIIKKLQLPLVKRFCSIMVKFLNNLEMLKR